MATHGGGAALVAPVTSLSQWHQSQQQSSEQIDPSQLHASIQRAFRDKGLLALIEFSAKLDKLQAQCETDGASGFSKAIVKKLFNDSGIALTEAESRALIRSLSVGDQVTAPQVRNVICSKMNDKRVQLVQNAFDQMDRQQVGYVAVAELYRWFDASKHPSVLFGDKSVDQVQDEFNKALAAIANKTSNFLAPNASNFVNLHQWMTLFQFQSVFFPSDDLFELFMRRVWRANAGSLTSTSYTSALTKQQQQQQPSTNLDPASKVAFRKANESFVSPLSSCGGDQRTSIAIGEQEYVSPTRLAMQSGAPMHIVFGKKKQPGAAVVSPPTDCKRNTQEFLKGSQCADCFRVGKPNDKNDNLPKNPNPMDVGTASIVDRLTQTLRSRGLGGIVRLQRALRALDAADDQDGQLTLAQLKQAIKDEQLHLNDVDVRLLFMYLDYDQLGKVSIASINCLIRQEPIHNRRLQIIQAAFETIDTDGDGSLDVHEIIQAFDAGRHPDVLAGKRSEHQVFEDFLDNFEVDFAQKDQETLPGQVHGRISLQQWQEFYKNVSFITKEDDLFDLLLRNTWQLAPREEDSSDSDRPRVSLSPKQHTKDQFEKEWKLHTKRHVSGGQGYQAMAVLQPNRDLEYEHLMRTKASALLDSNGCQYKVHQQSKEIRRVIAQIRNSLRDQGVLGFVALSRKFRQLDLDQNGSISFEEFQRALKDSKFFLSDMETRRIFEYFDTNHDNAIDFGEFLAGVQEPMNARRQLLVRMAFDALDRDGKGVLQVRDIVNTFDPRKHPEVVTGRKTEQDVLDEFHQTLDIDRAVMGSDQVMDFASWSRYYQNISATVEEDDYFEQLLCNTWHLNNGKVTATSNASNRRAPKISFGDDGAGNGNDDDDDSLPNCRRDRVQGLLRHPQARRDSDPELLTRSGGVVHLTDLTSRMPSFRKNTSNASAGFTKCIVMDTPNANPQQQLGRRRSMDVGGAAGKRSTDAQVAHPMGVQAILTRLKAILKARGAQGFCGLSRKFRLMDEDGNGSLSLAEFKKAIKTSELEVCDADLRLLFEYFDRDRSGSIDLGEFLSGIRDPMNPRRMGFVDQAFHLMDTDGNGLLEPADIVEKYDASRHPDVLNGRKTEDQVFREFLDTFDVDGVHNGKITWEQWVHYYQNISASIDQDDYFELMMRNAWHLAGGEGWCENSTDRRVLVTLEDGSQVVKEVKNDLGVKLQDVPARLKAQEDTSGSGSGGACDYSNFATSSRMDSEVNTPNSRNLSTAAPSSTATSTAGGGANSKKLSLKEAAAAIAMRAMTSSSSVNSPTRAAAMAASMASSSNVEIDAAMLLTSLRHHLQRRGLGELLQFRKQLLKHVDPRDDTISIAQFMESLVALGVRLRERQCEALVRLIEDQAEVSSTSSTKQQAWAFGGVVVTPRALNINSPRVSTKRMLDALFGRLSGASADQLRQLFTTLQRNGKGRVFPAALAKSFCAEGLPDVVLGLSTASDVFQMFAMHFEVASCSDGSISQEQFNVFGLHLFTSLGLSASSPLAPALVSNLGANGCPDDQDEYFAAVLRRCFPVA